MYWIVRVIDWDNSGELYLAPAVIVITGIYGHLNCIRIFCIGDMFVLVGDVPWWMNSLKLLGEESFPVLIKSACGLTLCDCAIAGVD